MRDLLSSEPVAYRNCLRILRDYGDQKAQHTIDAVINGVTEEQWAASFEKDNVLFNCLRSKGNHKFKYGFSKFILAELENTDSSSRIWENFDDIVEKLQDSDDVIEKLLSKYFKLETDTISDLAFNAISKYSSDFVSSVSPVLLACRVEYWLTKSQWGRISWLLDCDFNFDGDVKESLITIVEELYAQNGEEHKDLLLLTAETFGFEIRTSSVDREE